MTDTNLPKAKEIKIKPIKLGSFTINQGTAPADPSTVAKAIEGVKEAVEEGSFRQNEQANQ